MDYEKVALVESSALFVGDVYSEAVRQEAPGKFRCLVPGCTKLFKGEHYWKKHVEARHVEWLEARRAEVLNQQQRSEEVVSAKRRAARRSRLFAGVMVVVVLWMLTITSRPFCSQQGQRESHNAARPSSGSKKVALEAHIMSKCPDAQDCLLDLIVPVMANISDKVDFTLSYIGQLNSEDDSVDCMHGPEECLGNIIELCAANLYPDAKIHLGFTACMTKDYKSIPKKELVRECALEHGLDFDDLNDCASKDDGAFGMDLLRNSVARTSNAGVKYSCTVRLNDEIRCIRDGGEWRDCDDGHKPKDLISDIESAYDDGSD